MSCIRNICSDRQTGVLSLCVEIACFSLMMFCSQSYLNAHAYSNAETGDLLDALDNVSNLVITMVILMTNCCSQATTLDDGLTVADIMSTWTEQIGFPVVNVEAASNGHIIMLHQKHFLLNQTSIPPPSKYKFVIFMCFFTVSDMDVVVFVWHVATFGVFRSLTAQTQWMEHRRYTGLTRRQQVT